jgi:hypothetical protein
MSLGGLGPSSQRSGSARGAAPVDSDPKAHEDSRERCLRRDGEWHGRRAKRGRSRVTMA